MMKLEEKIKWFILPYPTLLIKVDEELTTCDLTSDYVMHEFADAHHRASARRAFVLKKIYKCLLI